jgi:hypothetical protein
MNIALMALISAWGGQVTRGCCGPSFFNFLIASNGAIIAKAEKKLLEKNIKLIVIFIFIFTTKNASNYSCRAEQLFLICRIAVLLLSRV